MKKGQIIQTAEHPLNLSDECATISEVMERISAEAFGGVEVQLLNAKNVPLADVEGTRGKLSELYVNYIDLVHLLQEQSFGSLQSSLKL